MTQVVNASPAPTPLTIGMIKLVPPAANRQRARLRLALAAALRSEKTSMRYVIMMDCVDTAVQPVTKVVMMGTAMWTRGA